MILLSVMTYRVVLRFSSAMMNATRARKRKKAARIALTGKLPKAGVARGEENRHGSWRKRAPATIRARTTALHHRRAMSRVGRVTSKGCSPEEDMVCRPRHSSGEGDKMGS